MCAPVAPEDYSVPRQVMIERSETHRGNCIMYVSASAQRFAIYAAIVTAVLYGIGFWYLTEFIPPPSPRLTAGQVVQLYAEQNFKFRLGVVVCLIAGGFNAWWSVAVAVQMARCERGIPVWALAQFAGGVLGTVLFVAPPLFWGVAAFSVDRDPGLTLLIHEIAFLTLVTPVSFFWIQALPIAVVSFSRTQAAHSAFPRWMGFFTVFMVVSAELGVIAQLFKSGPFAWNGLFTFWIPLSVFAVWFGVLCYTMLKAIGHQAHARTETEPAPSAAQGSWA